MTSSNHVTGSQMASASTYTSKQVINDDNKSHRKVGQNLVKIGLVIFELCEQTDRQTDILITIHCTTPGGEVDAH